METKIYKQKEHSSHSFRSLPHPFELFIILRILGTDASSSRLEFSLECSHQFSGGAMEPFLLKALKTTAPEESSSYIGHGIPGQSSVSVLQ